MSGWFLSEDSITGLQRDSVTKLLPKLKHAHFTNLRVRINGEWQEVEADWLKHMAPAQSNAEAVRAHSAEVKRFLEELAPYLGLEDEVGTFKPAELLAAAAKIREDYMRLQSLACERVPELVGKIPLVLYFDSREDADGFVAAVHEAKPGLESRQL